MQVGSRLTAIQVLAILLICAFFNIHNFPQKLKIPQHLGLIRFDPQESILDSKYLFWDAPNVFVNDSSYFSTNGK
jgi:hypothetical protein